MDPQELEKLIVKYLNRSTDKKEWEDLNHWIEQSENTEPFTEYLEINYAIDDVMSEFNTERTKASVLQKIKDDKSSAKKLRVLRVLKYAAVLLVLLGIGYFYQSDHLNSTTDSSLEPPEEMITLEMENGSMKVISEGETTEILNSKGEVIGTQQGNRLVYTTHETEEEELVYNQLTVPYGKRFELELSDGTLVYLNAGSSLKYPINFLQEGKREIFLIGEAFLEVAKDIDRQFILNANGMDVRVLGTKFNVSNYPEDTMTEVVLVEGSVNLSPNGKANHDANVILEPGFKGSFDRSQKRISTKPVITSIYTSWMSGDLVFRNMTFENILKKLERHYNLNITNRNKEFAQKKLNANFGNEPIETILEYFKVTYNISYSITKNEVVIN